MSLDRATTNDSLDGVVHYLTQNPDKEFVSSLGLPNEIIWEILGYLDLREDRNTLLNLRLACYTLNLIASKILLRNLEYSIGSDMEDVAVRLSEISSSPFIRNIKSLIIKSSAVMPEACNSKSAEILKKTSESYPQAVTIEARFRRNKFSYLKNISTSVSSLVSSIGSQVEKLDLRFQDEDKAEIPYFFNYFSSFLHHTLCYSSEHFTNLTTLSISISTANAISLYMLLENNSLSNPEFKELEARYKDTLGDSKDKMAQLVTGAAFPRIVYFPRVVKEIRFLEIEVITHEHNMYQYTGPEMRRSRDIIIFITFCRNLKSLRLVGGGIFWSFYDPEHYSFNPLETLSLLNLNCDSDLIAGRSPLSFSSNTLTVVELSGFNISRYSSCASSGLGTMYEQSGFKFSKLLDYIRLKMTNLVKFRMSNTQYIYLHQYRKNCVPAFTIPEDMGLHIGKTVFQRPLFTPWKRDITELVALRDALIQRRREKGMKEDLWLKSCVEYEEEISRLIPIKKEEIDVNDHEEEEYV